MRKTKQQACFTLVEVISSAVIIALGVTFMAGVLMAGQTFLQQANNKSTAVNIASYELDRQLVKSYSDLEEEMFGSDPVVYNSEVVLAEGNST
ncbi:MAG: hypothetical protein PHV17_08450, partial [Candidatus Omnitrophica bacterium]|nr:hypothetical protein [Candidatus Omnitrophota bacterium]